MIVPAHAQVTLSGTVYSDAGTTPDGTVRTINVAIGTSTPGVFASTSMVTTGAYTVTIPVGNNIASGTPILVWIDGGAVLGSVFTKASSSFPGANITGLDIYRNRLIVRHEGTSATSTTNTDLGFYTAAQDSDLQHSTTTGGIIISSPNELYVWPGDTFAPGGAVTVAGNAGAGATEGSMYVAAGSTYTAGGDLRLAGSLSVVSSATFSPGSSTIFFVATTTGKTIDAPVASIGNVTFSGSGGEWTFSSSATTSAFTILVGSVVAPATSLVVQGIYQNYSTFNNNSGTMTIRGPLTSTTGNFPTYTAGLDTSGSAAGTGNLAMNYLAVSSNGQTLYAAKAGSATACSQTSGSATGCELMVFNISNTSAPSFVTSRDVSGNNAGTGNLAINYLLVNGDYLYVAKAGSAYYLYVAKAGSATACSQTAGSAIGCELMVFDISSTTNPTYVAGRDMDGTAAGVQTIAATSLAIKDSSLYVAKAASGATACSTTALNCELMVFDISSTTNPTYITGRDASGSAAGVQSVNINSVSILGDILVAGKAGSATACSQTAGSAVGCELMLFDISSTTNPTYVSGRDTSGSAAGTGNLATTFVTGTGTIAYIAKAANATACSQTAGSATGCEVMAFDISSTTNPTYVRGVDRAGSQTGVQSSQVSHLYLAGTYLFASNAANATVCEQNTGLTIGCELTMFDVSSSTALRQISSRDAGGAINGVQTLAHTAAVSVGSMLFVARAGSATACSQTVGSAVGCELAAFSWANQPSGILMGNLSGSSALGNITATGTVEFRDVATTSSLTITTGTTTLPSQITVTGNFQNNANVIWTETTLQLDSSAAQTVGGTLTGTNEMYHVRFSGVGAKSFTNNASTTFLTIDSGANVAFPSLLTIRDTYTNSGTATTASSVVYTNGTIGSFLAGASVGGSLTDASSIAVNSLVRVGTMLYAGKANSNTACSQTAGSAVGCELMVFNVSTTTSPLYVAGRDITGNNTGTGNIVVNHLAVSSNSQTLYMAKAGDATACSQTAGSATGCELMVFDISSTTNPVYVAGRDATGDSTGVGNVAMSYLTVDGNYLYVAKAANATACSQTAGSATGCELMVFDISSTTNPVYVAGRDVDGTAAGVASINISSLVANNSVLYVSKAAAGATACSTTASNCEIMVFSISSSTNPTYITGRDASASAAGTQTLAVNNLTVNGSLLLAAKAGSATACSQTAGSAVGCELMVFDISSTTNPTYVAGRDVTGDSTGVGNLGINFVAATGSLAYVAKAGSATACSEVAGSATGCELMVFDISSTTNPVFMRGVDASLETSGELSLSTTPIVVSTSTIMVGRAASAIPCEQIWNQRVGCELLLMKLPTTLTGTMTGTSRLTGLTTVGFAETQAAASTTDLTVASSSVLALASNNFSIAGNFTRNGELRANQSNVYLAGANQTLTAVGTTTFYDLTLIATTTATTTFSAGSTVVVQRNAVLSGVSTSTRLALRSGSAGTQWRLDAQSSSTVTLTYLDIKDSNNISATATPLVCSVGCYDSGNNTNWTIGLMYTVSGVVYAEDGVTPYATATAMRLVVPLATNYIANATSATTTGVFSFSVSDQYFATGTPFIVFTDGASAMKSNTITKTDSLANISGLHLYRNHVIVRSESGTSVPVTNADLSEYTSADDSDIRYTVGSSDVLTVTSPAALVVWDDTSYTPGAIVTITGNASTTLTDGSLLLRDGSVYTPTGKTAVAGSLRASSTATYTSGLAVLEFNATTTGKVIDAQVTTLGNVSFNGTGGAWSFTQTNATTSDFDIKRGTVTAPSGNLVVNGFFANNATFTNNSGDIIAVGNTLDDNARAATFVAGLDNRGQKTTNGAQSIEALHIAGNYLYRGINSNSNACSQTAGSGGTGCDLVVFDISSTTNPVYVAGRDADGSAAGTTTGATFNDIVTTDNYLFVAATASSTSCGQTAGSAFGCELQVYDISSTTNPVYVAGRDVDGGLGGAAGTSYEAIVIAGDYLYVTTNGSTTACTQIAGSAAGCELQVYDISDPTNPVYVAGRDSDGSSSGVTGKRTKAIFVYGSTLYIGKDGDSSVSCAQTAGSAVGCELIYFNIASSTNPVFAGGRDSDGASNGSNDREINSIFASKDVLVIGKEGGSTACAQTAGSATGCEIVVFDISSTTNPVFVAGRDMSGDDSGIGLVVVESVYIHGNNLYVGKDSNTTACSQIAGQANGCEFMVFDLSSTTNPVFVAGRDNSGSTDGVEARTINVIRATGNTVYVGKTGLTTNCTDSTVGTGAIGCELMMYQSYQPAGVLSGTLTGAQALSGVETRNLVSFSNNASTTNLTIATSSTMTTPTLMSLAGDLTNNGTLDSASGNTFWASSSATQTISGGVSSSATFDTLTFVGSGAKNLSMNATATTLTVSSGATVNQSGRLTVAGDYTNSGTVAADASSELVLTGEKPLGSYVVGRDVSGTSNGTTASLMYNVEFKDAYAYVTKVAQGTNCSNTIAACELQIYDMSSSTNPVYVSGRDVNGDTSAGSLDMFDVAIKGNYLYVTKGGSATACSQTAGSAIGCELMVFDISSSTNPTYVAGRDASGNSAGTGAVNVNDLVIVGDYLYVTKAANATACSQTAGSATGCELMVFDISSSTNPVYVAGRDASGNSTGTGSVNITSISATDILVVVGKGANATACSQTAGSAIGCELMVFDISSPTSPTYVAGRDASGDNVGVGNVTINTLTVQDDWALIGKLGDATACSQTAGSATGCELMVFDISSSTNPTYVAGRDSSGDSDGTGAVEVVKSKSRSGYWYVGKVGDVTACSQTAGSAIGCELMVFDISSSTNPVYVAGTDADGSTTGTGEENIGAINYRGNSLVALKSANSNACSQTAGSAIGCEFMSFSIGNTLRGNMTGTSALRSVTMQGATGWYNNASTTNLTIDTNGVASMPTDLSVAGDFINNGEFWANNATVTLTGTDQYLASDGDTTFYNLSQQATTSATTTFSSTGRFMTTGFLQLNGTSSARIKLRSDVEGTQWTLYPYGSTSATWLDVKDARNSSSTYITCTTNCIDRGNNMNWIFFPTVLGTGSTTLVAHSGGQITDNFDESAKTDAALLAFRLQPNSGTTTYNALGFTLQGNANLNQSAFTNFRLVVDANSNQVFDGGDSIIGGTGDVVWTVERATLGFFESFTATTSADYLVIADWSVPVNGSFMSVSLSPSDIVSTDTSGTQTIFGQTVRVQHHRNNRGGGGGSSSVGGDAPAGAGNVGGGGVPGGELIGSDPDFFWPTSQSGSWNNGALAYDGVDGTYATTAAATNHSYTNHGFGIPTNNTISGIVVKLELSGNTAAGSVDVQLSWDGGTSWTSTKNTGTLTTADAVRTLGSPSDLWGRAWSSAEFGNANFAVRVVGSPSSNTISLDAIQVRVYHVVGGGGGGGGGAI